MTFGLSENTIASILNTFLQFPEVDEAVLYGSRAKGNYKNGSDIDITLKGAKLNLSLLAQISSRLDDLPIPYTIDLSIYHHIRNEDLRDHIARVGKIILNKESLITKK